MIHYLYLGHFDHEANFIRFEKREDTKPAWYRPVIVRPLNSGIIAELLAEKGLSPSTVPDGWGLAFEEEGFLVCDRYTRSREARDFVKRLATRTKCDVVDYGSFSLIAPDELWPEESRDTSQQVSEKTAR